jgi:hypothetical protein
MSPEIAMSAAAAVVIVILVEAVVATLMRLFGL